MHTPLDIRHADTDPLKAILAARGAVDPARKPMRAPDRPGRRAPERGKEPPHEPGYPPGYEHCPPPAPKDAPAGRPDRGPVRRMDASADPRSVRPLGAHAPDRRHHIDTAITRVSQDLDAALRFRQLPSSFWVDLSIILTDYRDLRAYCRLDEPGR